MKIGEHIRTEIRDVAFGGDGVGRNEDLVIFVPFTVDGDEVEVEITAEGLPVLKQGRE